jgi:hypothetical protein
MWKIELYKPSLLPVHVPTRFPSDLQAAQEMAEGGLRNMMSAVTDQRKCSDLVEGDLGAALSVTGFAGESHVTFTSLRNVLSVTSVILLCYY